MRRWSCESILEKNNKYNQKIKVISNRMSNLEKDIQEIKMRNISPFLSTKDSTKNFTINFNNFDKNERIHYISNSNPNSNNRSKKEENIHYISNSNSNILKNLNKNRHCCQCSLRNFKNLKQKSISHNSSIINIHNNHMSMRKNYNKNIYISKEELEYEYEIRTLKRKLEELKKKNEKINNKLYLLKEKNDNLEFNINSYRSTYENINDAFNEGSKNKSINSQVNIMKYKRKLIDKIMDIFKSNIFNFNFSFTSNKRSKEDYSILNMLLNLMDMKFIYENGILNDAFLMGVDLLYQTNFPKYPSLKRKDKIITYTNNLISHEKKLEMENHKYDIIKQYYILYQKFEGIKNLNEFLNNIIMKNIKVDQKINKIKSVLNFEKIIKGKENDKDNGINRSKIIKNVLTRNKNKSFNYDKYSLYTTNYNNNKISHNNYNIYNRNNNLLKYGKNTNKLKYNNALKINKKINNKTNLVIYNKNKEKNFLMKNEKLKSKSLSKKKSQIIL